MSDPAGPQAAPPQEQIDRMLADLRSRFLDTVEARILEFEAIGRMVGRDLAPARALARVRHEIHKISGVAASLGFADLGRLAAALEAQIDAQSCRMPPDALWASVWPGLDRLLDEMEACLDG